MLYNIDSLDAGKQRKYPGRMGRFAENVKRAVRNTLAAAGIATSSVSPMATTSTFIPATVNTITAVAPTVASTAAKTIALGTAASLLTACGEDEPEIKDTTPPTINVSHSEMDITGGKEVYINGNQLYIGNTPVASRYDNKTKNCGVALYMNGKNITSGTIVSEEGTLTIRVIDDDGNVKTVDIKLNIAKNAPSITVNQYEVNVFGGEVVSINNNQLLLGDEVIAIRNDDNLESCKVSLSFNGQAIKSGDTISEAGTLTITITNKNSKTSTAEITVTNDAIYGLENLRNATLQVDKEINLLNGISFANGVELVKTEIEIDGKRTAVDPNHYTPSYPGTINVIFTIKGIKGNTAEVKVDNLNVNALEYKAITITNINPEDLMPKVEVGDKNIYKHIEHLRIPESTVITDMMWKYGAGKHTAEEYQKLMMRLNTGMIGENPVDYNNYESVGGAPYSTPSNHAHAEWFTLNTLVNHANFKIIDCGDYYEILNNLCKSDPNKMNIMGISIGSDVDRETYNSRNIEQIKQFDKEKNVLIFSAGSNIRYKDDGTITNKIYQENYSLPDNHSVYTSASRAHSKDDNTINMHHMLTFGTDGDGDIDQTNEEAESSKFPVGFHKKVLFSGREFPHRNYSGDKIRAATGKYATSHTNYVNVAIACKCFQMFAEVENMDQLLEMIRSTSLKDYIRFNGETQELQLMNPAGFFKKYLMPTNLPTSIQSSKTISLNKGYYKGVIFDIPGAEVKINGQWIAYNESNKSLIKTQNPMTLEWRLNGDLCKKMGYKGKTVNGKIIVVDDQWNGLNIDNGYSVNII